jgi:hypothetical protein
MPSDEATAQPDHQATVQPKKGKVEEDLAWTDLQKMLEDEKGHLAKLRAAQQRPHSGASRGPFGLALSAARATTPFS